MVCGVSCVDQVIGEAAPQNDAAPPLGIGALKSVVVVQPIRLGDSASKSAVTDRMREFLILHFLLSTRPAGYFGECGEASFEECDQGVDNGDKHRTLPDDQAPISRDRFSS